MAASRHRAPSGSAVGTVLGALQTTRRADPRGFLVGAFLQMVGALSPTALVVVGQYLIRSINSAPGERPALAHLVLPVIALSLSTALTLAATNLQRQQQRLLGERVSAVAWEDVLAVSTRVRLALYENAEFYDRLERVKNNAFTQLVAVTTAVFGMIGGLVGVASLIVVLVTIDPLLVPLLVVAGLPSLALSRVVSRMEFRFAVRVAPLYRARGYLRIILTGRDEAKEIRTFAAGDALRHRHSERNDEFDAQLRSHVRRRQSFALLDVVIASVFLALTLGYVVWALSQGRIGLAAAAAAILAVRFVSSGLNALFASLGSLFESATFLRDMQEFLTDRRNELESSAEGDGVGPLRDGIDVRDVCFSYPGGRGLVLDHVSLTIKADEVVALVGENGSGKTTLAKILAGLYRPDSGRIMWDDIDLATVSPADLRRQVSVIFQDFVRYQLSALENVGLGDPDHVDDLTAAREAAERAGAREFVESMPLSWQTVLSKEYSEGQDLSGGQWQRVALARAIRKASSLVVLDEPTAAMDPKSEARLFSDIRATLEGRAALLISHRFSSVRLADRIYVLQHGRVVESGRHDVLVRRGGLYADLFRAQAQAYR